jgi:hypothetical protein
MISNQNTKITQPTIKEKRKGNVKSKGTSRAKKKNYSWFRKSEDDREVIDF